MESRSLAAEIFFSMPSHLWVLPVAGVVAFFGMRLAAQSRERESLFKGVTYLILLALALLPNAYYLLSPPTPDMAELLAQGGLLPNYKGLVYLDAFYAFAGWALSWVVRQKFDA